MDRMMMMESTPAHVVVQFLLLSLRCSLGSAMELWSVRAFWLPLCGGRDFAEALKWHNEEERGKTLRCDVETSLPHVLLTFPFFTSSSRPFLSLIADMMHGEWVNERAALHKRRNGHNRRRLMMCIGIVCANLLLPLQRSKAILSWGALRSKRKRK